MGAEETLPALAAARTYGFFSAVYCVSRGGGHVSVPLLKPHATRLPVRVPAEARLSLSREARQRQAGRVRTRLEWLSSSSAIRRSASNGWPILFYNSNYSHHRARRPDLSTRLH